MQCEFYFVDKRFNYYKLFFKGLATVKYDLKFSKDSFKHQFELELHNKSIEM
jgi:hypothetical protein